MFPEYIEIAGRVLKKTIENSQYKFATYHSPVGNWEIDARIEKGELISISEYDYMNGKKLKFSTETEYKRSNEGFI